MNKLLISCLIIFFSFSISADEFKNKKTYYYGFKNDQIEIIGTKKSIKKYSFLFLPNPIDVNVKNSDKSAFDQPEKDIKIIQIARDFDDNIPNGCVILKGYLYHADNANHKTKVLIWADSYRPCNERLKE